MTSQLLEQVETVEGTIIDYKKLAHYHYQPEIQGPATLIFKIVGKGENYYKLPDPISVIVYMQPFPEITARTNATADYFHQYNSAAESLKLLNQNVLYLSRLITDPRFRRQGLAKKLVKESLSLLDIPIVETLLPIDFTNQMYEKAGFEISYIPTNLAYKKLEAAIKAIGLDLNESLHPTLLYNRLKSLTGQQCIETEKAIALFLARFRNADRFGQSLERAKFILSKVPPPKVYAIWFNPRSPKAAEILSFKPGQAI